MPRTISWLTAALIVVLLHALAAGAGLLPDPRLDLAAPAGVFGDTVGLSGTLVATSAQVAGIKADMTAPRDGVEFLATDSGSPDCTVDPSLNKSFSLAFLPPLCQFSGPPCNGVQVYIFD